MTVPENHIEEPHPTVKTRKCHGSGGNQVLLIGKRSYDTEFGLDLVLYFGMLGASIIPTMIIDVIRNYCFIVN